MTLSTLLYFLGASVALTVAIAKYFDWLTAGVFASFGVKLALAEK